jgi:hypothetical protein
MMTEAKGKLFTGKSLTCYIDLLAIASAANRPPPGKRDNLTLGADATSTYLFFNRYSFPYELKLHLN